MQKQPLDELQRRSRQRAEELRQAGRPRLHFSDASKSLPRLHHDDAVRGLGDEKLALPRKM